MEGDDGILATIIKPKIVEIVKEFKPDSIENLHSRFREITTSHVSRETFKEWCDKMDIKFKSTVSILGV
jgi:hypothetical protein